MLNENDVSTHYTHGNLLGAIQESVGKIGKTPDSVTIDELGPVDEFHIGGRPATEHLLSQLNFSKQDHILDIGCGLGGASRYIANTHKNRVSGIDLTEEYIDTGNAMCEWVGLDNQVSLYQGSALAMPFDEDSFDGALMLHVGMNIENKAKLFSEVFRVMRPGSSFGVYDIMRTSEGAVSYPTTWATDENTSSLATPEEYRQALTQAGFTVSLENNRSEFAKEFFKQMRAKIEANGGPPPIGLHILMQDSAPVKIKNLASDVMAGTIAPVEMIAHKP